MADGGLGDVVCAYLSALDAAWARAGGLAVRQLVDDVAPAMAGPASPAQRRTVLERATAGLRQLATGEEQQHHAPRGTQTVPAPPNPAAAATPGGGFGAGRGRA